MITLGTCVTNLFLCRWRGLTPKRCSESFRSPKGKFRKSEFRLKNRTRSGRMRRAVLDARDAVALNDHLSHAPAAQAFVIATGVNRSSPFAPRP